MINLMKRFMTEESGQGMTEYGLVVAVIAIMLIATLATFREKIKAMFDNSSTELGNYPTTAATTTTTP